MSRLRLITCPREHVGVRIGKCRVIQDHGVGGSRKEDSSEKALHYRMKTVIVLRTCSGRVSSYVFCRC